MAAIRRKSKQMWSRGGWARNGWGRQQEQHLGLGVSCQLHRVPTAAVCCSSEKEQFLGFCDKEETIWWTGLAYGKASRGQHLPEPQVKFHSGSLYSPAPHCLQLWGSSNTLRMCFSLREGAFGPYKRWQAPQHGTFCFKDNQPLSNLKTFPQTQEEQLG